MIKISEKEELRQQVIDRYWETIPLVWNQVKNNLRSIATEKFDISVEQFHILRHIRKGISSVSDLAAIRQISRPAISQAVDVLVDKGLISRQQVVEDRRYVHLMLTPKGDELLNKIFQENRAWMAEIIAPLSTQELNSIFDALDILKTTFENSTN